MIRSKIDPTKVKDLAWKDYAKLFEKDVKQAQDKGVEKVPLIMISDFTFACGEVHALLLLGKQSEMTKFFKSLKMEEERKKLKDFSMGFCYFDKEEDGSNSMRISIEGFGKPNKMKKNSKKLIKKLGIKLKDLIKGQYTDEVVQDIEEDNAHLTEQEIQEQATLDDTATTLQQEDDTSNDGQKLQAVVKEFITANKEMTTNVISLLKASKTERVIFTTAHINMAEAAFRAAASLVDKYQEETEAGKDLAKSAKKISALHDNIVKNDLVKKYQTIWKKVQLEYNKQIDGLSAPFKEKLSQLKQLLKEIAEEGQTA
ncbi:MAG: hypothetical protein ACRBFS_13600 [Aureispira sp.]